MQGNRLAYAIFPLTVLLAACTGTVKTPDSVLNEVVPKITEKDLERCRKKLAEWSDSSGNSTYRLTGPLGLVTAPASQGGKSDLTIEGPGEAKTVPVVFEAPVEVVSSGIGELLLGVKSQAWSCEFVLENGNIKLKHARIRATSFNQPTQYYTYGPR